MRIINTDNGIMPVWVSGATFELAAVDGTDVVQPTPIEGRKVLVAAGGRVDLRVKVPPSGEAVRVEMGGAALVLGRGVSSGTSHSGAAGRRRPARPTARRAACRSTPTSPDRSFDYSIGRRPGFLNGRPGVQWTINGKMFPAVPMFMVSEGDVVVVHIDNHSGETHPMHLHGHHVVVLARDGVKATGSPWWTDSLEVNTGRRWTSRSSPTTPGSGWTTATTSPTPRRASWRT